MAGKATTSIKLDRDVKDRLDHIAERQQRSAHWLMKQAISEYVERTERREQFARDADDALAEYDRTGLHLTHDEVESWFDKVLAGEKTDLPECHS